MPEAVLVSAVRTPIGRAPKGALSTSRPDDLAAIAINGALEKVPALNKAEVEDVILGCAQPEGEQGWDVARWAVLRAGLPVDVPGVTVNRLCSSGLEAIALADLRIRGGAARLQGRLTREVFLVVVAKVRTRHVLVAHAGDTLAEFLPLHVQHVA